jgi:hypothetical protein
MNVYTPGVIPSIPNYDIPLNDKLFFFVGDIKKELLFLSKNDSNKESSEYYFLNFLIIYYYNFLIPLKGLIFLFFSL